MWPDAASNYMPAGADKGFVTQVKDIQLQALQKAARAHSVDPATWVKYFEAVSCELWPWSFSAPSLYS
jgi:hypothetical protein